jgi:teichoic acid transport system ATP-binding protein
VNLYNRVATSNDSHQGGQKPLLGKSTFDSSSIGPNDWFQYFELNLSEDRYGSQKAEILEAGIFTLDNFPIQKLERNQEYLIKIKVRYNSTIPAAIVAYTIKDHRGVVLCGTNTLFQGVEMGIMKASDVIVVAFRQSIRLNPGKFILCVGCANYENGEYVVYDRRFDYLFFDVVSSEPRVGLVDLDSTIEWTRLDQS